MDTHTAMLKRVKNCLQITVALGIVFGSLAFIGYQAQDMAQASDSPALIGISPRYHDDENLVTCWVHSRGLSCLPDYQLKRTPPAR